MQRVCISGGRFFDGFIIFDYLNKSNERITENDRMMMDCNRVVMDGGLELIQVYRYGNIDNMILVKVY